jgi:hypothetical protein
MMECPGVADDIVYVSWRCIGKLAGTRPEGMMPGGEHQARARVAECSGTVLVYVRSGRMIRFKLCDLEAQLVYDEEAMH